MLIDGVLVVLVELQQATGACVKPGRIFSSTPSSCSRRAATLPSFAGLRDQ